ncbi:hypothetical protein Tco_1320253 [Tanacetum coccineum]
MDAHDTSGYKAKKQVEIQTVKTNNSLLPSTRVITSTKASRSKPRRNAKKNRILQASSSNQKKNKVEDHHRSIMSSSNKKNRISFCNTNTKHVILDANSKFVCSTCNACLFSTNRYKCVVAYLNDVSSCVKSKSDKNKKKEWKSTGIVFTSVGHRWLPTHRTFTIDGTQCPLTRIIATKIAPPKETSQTPVITSSPEIEVYRRRPKVARSVRLSTEPSILGSRPSNILEPNKN